MGDAVVRESWLALSSEALRLLTSLPMDEIERRLQDSPLAPDPGERKAAGAGGGTMNSYGISYGALADDIEDQLRRQGWTLGDRAGRFQRWADEISSLRIHGLLTEAESNRARKRLWKEITANALPLPEAQP